MATSAPPRPAVAFHMAMITLAAGFAAVLAAYGVETWSHDDKAPLALTDAGPTVELSIAGHPVTVPAAWLASGDLGEAGFVSEIKLRVALPLGPEASPVAVEVTLLPRSRVRPSAALLDGVYLHQFASEQEQGPVGLVGKPLAGGGGFGGETVWYDPLSPNPFVAKCLEPATPAAPSNCVRFVYLNSGIAAVYAFDAGLLTQWQRFDGEMGKWLERMGA